MSSAKWCPFCLGLNVLNRKSPCWLFDFLWDHWISSDCYTEPWMVVTCAVSSSMETLKAVQFSVMAMWLFNTLRPRQDDRHFPDDIFKWIFLNGNVWIAIKVSLKFVPKGSINNIPPLVQIMAWRRPGDKPLSEPMMVILLWTHTCVTRPQWVNDVVCHTLTHWGRVTHICVGNLCHHASDDGLLPVWH